MKSKELEEEEERNKLQKGGAGTSEFLCNHDDSGEPPFAHGLCKDCYDEVNSEFSEYFVFISLDCTHSSCSLLKYLEALAAD